MNPSTIIKHPLTIVAGLSTAVSYLFQVPGLDLLTGWLWANAGSLFWSTSIISTQIAPVVPTIPAEPFQVATLILAIIAVATRLEGPLSSLSDKIKERF